MKWMKKITMDMELDMTEFNNYRKKPIIIQAKQIKKDFVVMTREGFMYAKAGDYLAIGVEGELYPIKKEIFEQTYDVVE